MTTGPSETTGLAARTSPVDAAGAVGDQTIVLIDGAEAVHRLLKSRLTTETVCVLTAASGPAGLALVEQHRADVILVDLDSPGSDGFGVLRSLKESATTCNTPVVVLSGASSPQDKVTAFDLGAIDYISKPFDMLELRVRVRSALRLSALVRLLAERAQIDGLTGVYNRAHFDKRLAEELSGAQRHGRPLALAMFDLDKFKSINDTYGHPAGDAVIQGLAQLLRAECRTCDVPCRFGGEEFALIMPDTSPDQGMVVCERVRLKLSAMRWARHPERQVTVSSGVSGFASGQTGTAAQVIEQADKCLYEAKQDGRDRVCGATIDGAAVQAPMASANLARAA